MPICATITETYLLLGNQEEGTLSEHPIPQAVAGLLHGSLSPGDARSVVAHLIHGCGDCEQALWPPVEEEAYEKAISGVIATAESRQREWAQAEAWLTTYFLKGRQPFSQYPLLEKKRLATWGLCEFLLKASFALRLDYPQEMVHLAEIAVEVAGLMPFAPFRFDQVRDMEARAWIELANAYRIVDDLPRAEMALGRSLDRYELGTHEPLLLARLRDIAASLFAAQRRFKMAFQALSEARAIFKHAGDHHSAGRVLIKAGLFAGYDGDPVTGIELLVKGLAEIDRKRESNLVFRALHNIILFYVELENYKEAQRLLRQLRPLYIQLTGPVDRPKLAALEGKIAAGLGDFKQAEKALSEARQSYEHVGLPYYAAVVGLELAAIWFRQGLTGRVKGIVGQLVTAFRSIRVEREAIAALVLLHNAAAHDRATMELIEKVRGMFGRLASEPPRREPLV